nr:MAG TPA: hypothetical protein [Caudoviricetes sp.]
MLTEFDIKKELAPLKMIYRLRGNLRKSERAFLLIEADEFFTNLVKNARGGELSSDVMLKAAQVVRSLKQEELHSRFQNAARGYLETGVAASWKELRAVIRETSTLRRRYLLATRQFEEGPHD